MTGVARPVRRAQQRREGASGWLLALCCSRRRLLHGALEIQIAGKMARNAMIIVGHCQRRRHHPSAPRQTPTPALYGAILGLIRGTHPQDVG